MIVFNLPHPGFIEEEESRQSKEESKENYRAHPLDSDPFLNSFNTFYDEGDVVDDKR